MEQLSDDGDVDLGTYTVSLVQRYIGSFNEHGYSPQVMLWVFRLTRSLLRDIADLDITGDGNEESSSYVPIDIRCGLFTASACIRKNAQGLYVGLQEEDSEFYRSYLDFHYNMMIYAPAGEALRRLDEILLAWSAGERRDIPQRTFDGILMGVLHRQNIRPEMTDVARALCLRFPDAVKVYADSAAANPDDRGWLYAVLRDIELEGQAVGVHVQAARPRL